MSRRAILRTSLGVGAGAVVGRSVGAVERAVKRPRSVRFAHLTDMHVHNGGRSADGLGAALATAEGTGAEFIVTGGDHVMDAFFASRSAASGQFDLYQRALAENTRLAVYAVMGNHDVFGWGDAKGGGDRGGTAYGKEMAADRLRMRRPWYSFEREGWTFVCLDNIARRGNGYYGGLDAAQAEWLKGELGAAARAGRPVCVFSHIPLVSACAMFDANHHSFYGNEYRVPDTLMHEDVGDLLDLLARHGVRLCVSGHIHLRDRVEYRGMTFVCDGSVCGNWWKGANRDVAEGFGLFDLFADGSIAYEYRTFGWRAG